jgi:hypothetical protein
MAGPVGSRTGRVESAGVRIWQHSNANESQYETFARF